MTMAMQQLQKGRKETRAALLHGSWGPFIISPELEARNRARSPSALQSNFRNCQFEADEDCERRLCSLSLSCSVFSLVQQLTLGCNALLLPASQTESVGRFLRNASKRKPPPAVFDRPEQSFGRPAHVIVRSFVHPSEGGKGGGTGPERMTSEGQGEGKTADRTDGRTELGR